MPHRAISDARVTARMVSVLCSDDPMLIDNHRLAGVTWPSLAALRTPCFRRENARQRQDEPPRFLQRLAARVHHDVDAEEPNVLAYMALIDRVLEDRRIDENEEEVLVDAALSWRLSSAQLNAAHARYLHNLAVLALGDGVVTESERRDLHSVAKLLGQDDSALDSMLEFAARQLKTVRPDRASQVKKDDSLQGQRVCFTGELVSTMAGQPITRDLAESLASRAGCVVASGVTKKLDILVVADPNTQSGKARKAREYGVRIISDAVFWRLAGVAVD